VKSEVVSGTQIFIVTGYSGAGKSSVLGALEDLGFFCVDNLPIGLLSSFFHLVSQPNTQGQKVALGIDIRVSNNMHELVDQLITFNKKQLCHVKVVFLTASSEVLLKRFQETRRKHPLTDPLDLLGAIEHEKILLKPLKDISDFVIDTDQFNIHELRNFVRKFLATENKPRLLVSLISFGFKYGVPSESNFLFDVRSLPNPYFIADLRAQDGTQNSVRDYLFSQKEVQEYWQRLHDFFLFSIEKSYNEGRFFLHFAIGCTGGRHRSVALVQELAQVKLDNVQFLIKHRDISKDLARLI
jgi:RNase adapter protein RapZ